MLVGHVDCVGNVAFELCRTENRMVGWRNYDIRIGVDSGDNGCRIGDAGSRIAAERLAENLIVKQVGNLAANLCLMDLGGDNNDVLAWADALESAESRLYERFSCAHKVNKLFGLVDRA